MKKYLVIVLSVLTLAGCHGNNGNGPEPDPEIKAATQVFLKVKGNVVFRYEEGTTQLGYNEKLREFRAGNDDMSSFFTLTCSELPTREGQQIKADLRWTSGSTVKTSTGITFTVEAMESTGLVRLWCAADKTGAVVKILR